jgi:uncharacterized protein YprB with RNaseH-like and TPR domain
MKFEMRGNLVGQTHEDTPYVLDPLFWDIETTDLNTSMGRMLASGWVKGSWAESDKKVKGLVKECNCHTEIYMVGSDSHCPLKGNDRCPRGCCDLELALRTRDALEEADFIVTWNGKRFDVPFLNGRLIAHHQRPVNPKMHHDAMYLARAHSFGIRVKWASLKHVSEVFEAAHRKTPLDFNIWKQAIAGEREALNYIGDHNHRDVLVTREMWGRLKPIMKNLHR